MCAAAWQWTHCTVSVCCGLPSMNCWENETKETAFRKLWNSKAHLHWNLLRPWTSFSTDLFLNSMRVSSRFSPELLPRTLRLSWHSFPETQKNIYESFTALIWQTINIISTTLTLTHNSHREVEITNVIAYMMIFLFILFIKQKLSSKVTSSKWGVWEYLFPMRKMKQKNPNHIMDRE